MLPRAGPVTVASSHFTSISTSPSRARGSGAPRRPPARAPCRPRAAAAFPDASGDPITAAFNGDPIPPRLNNIPHTREVRRHFYGEVAAATAAALATGAQRLSVRATFPELNTEFDVYRAGTLLEMVRETAAAMTADGRSVKICVQQSLGQGVFQATPMSLNGVMRIMKGMDWGAAAPFVQTGHIGGGEVPGADAFILVAPQNITGQSVLPFVEEMVEAAGAAGKPVVLVNPKLGDIPGAGVMGVRGRQGRMDFVSTFEQCYHFRLLYLGAAMYPIMGALRYSFGGPWEVFRRAEFVGEGGARGERYELAGRFESEPGAGEITACFQRRKRT